MHRDLSLTFLADLEFSDQTGVDKKESKKFSVMGQLRRQVKKQISAKKVAEKKKLKVSEDRALAQVRKDLLQQGLPHLGCEDIFVPDFLQAAGIDFRARVRKLKLVGADDSFT